jgi:hypothetical protein
MMLQNDCRQSVAHQRSILGEFPATSHAPQPACWPTLLERHPQMPVLHRRHLSCRPPASPCMPRASPRNGSGSIDRSPSPVLDILCPLIGGVRRAVEPALDAPHDTLALALGLVGRTACAVRCLACLVPDLRQTSMRINGSI